MYSAAATACTNRIAQNAAGSNWKIECFLKYERGGKLLYNKIKALCQERGMSIKALEQAAELGNGTVGKWRTSTPTLRNLIAVAHVLGVTMDRLLQGRGKEEYA